MTGVLSDADLARLAELDKAATPGPWSFYNDDLWAGATAEDIARADAIYASGISFSDEAEDVYDRAEHLFHGDPKEPADAALIAESRNALSALLAEVSAGRERDARVRALHWKWREEAVGDLSFRGGALRRCADDLLRALEGDGEGVPDATR